jgi:hypothetical protein
MYLAVSMQQDEYRVCHRVASDRVEEDWDDIPSDLLLV